MNTIVQIGAGNIGRGFIGQLFFEAGYAIQFVDVDEHTVAGIRRKKKYTVELVGESRRRLVTVSNISAIDARDVYTVSQALAVCSLASISVGVAVVLNTVPLIIAGFRERLKIQNTNPLNILICENSASVTKELQAKVREELGDSEYDAFCRLVAFVSASIGRMVPQRTARLQEGFLNIVAEEYGELPVDKDAWLGDFPKVQGMFAYSPFRFITQRKLYVHNMGHAMAAYLGRIVGDEYIRECIVRPEIAALVRGAMEESARALAAEYEDSLEAMHEYTDALLRRFGNRGLDDTVARVGRDVRRKLSPEDRFVGAINLCDKHLVGSSCVRAGLVAGVLYALHDDAEDAEIRTLYKIGGLPKVLEVVCGLENIGDFREYYSILETDATLKSVLRLVKNATMQGDCDD